MKITSIPLTCNATECSHSIHITSEKKRGVSHGVRTSLFNKSIHCIEQDTMYLLNYKCVPSNMHNYDIPLNPTFNNSKWYDIQIGPPAHSCGPSGLIEKMGPCGLEATGWCNMPVSVMRITSAQPCYSQF